MGEVGENASQLRQEQFRVNTYRDHTFPNGIDKFALARSGFYYTNKGNLVKCFNCNLEVDTAKLNTAEINRVHVEKAPMCISEITINSPNSQNRSKKFVSYDSLRFEKERLETFIDWPVPWLKPTDLAHDGFYYLRTVDHCACVFCRGIVGAWEKGDTPRGEHQRHFPHCPFVKGQPVGNIPLEHSHIISRISPRSEVASTDINGFDVCGSGRHMPGSYSEKTGPSDKPYMDLEGMGLPQHSGPKRRDYLTYESRLASYVSWPELVKQKPKELADAGFFYCGLSDHVRCFHCGNGLRNWETDDIPWREHARWYPECNFVLLTKGQEYIDQVRRECPPYIRSQPSASTSTSTPASTSTSTRASVRPTVTDEELNPLMELDIIQAVLVMGFPEQKVRAALKRKLEQTGMPFFSLEPCIESVLQYMEEETRQTLNQRSNQEIEAEATGEQAAKMEALQPGTRNSTAMEASSSGTQRPTSPHPSTSASESTNPPLVTIPSTSSSSPSVPSSPQRTRSTPSHVPVSSSSSLPSIPSTSSLPSIPSTSSSLSSMSNSSSLPSLPRPLRVTTAMPVTISSDEPMEVDDPVTGSVPESDPESINVINRANEVITQANEVIGMAERALKPASSSPPSSLEHMEIINEPASIRNLAPNDNNSTSNIMKMRPCAVPVQQSSELADELEKIRESRMCKVCMDAEMSVVFLPCTHMVTCTSCALAIAQCPICREDIKYTIKPILS